MEEQLINPLRKEKVILKFIPRQNKRNLPANHVLKDGKMQGSKDTFTVPMLNGMYVKVLTDSEQAYFENMFGFPKHHMDNSRIENNYWSDANFENTINSVTLGKDNNVFDLSNPVDYIKYKILLANKETVCESQHEFEMNPKPTYKYIILREEQQVSFAKAKLEKTKRAWSEYGKIEDNYDLLKYIVEASNPGLKIASNTKLELLQIKVTDLIEKNIDKFFEIYIEDKTVRTKVLIRRATEKMIIVCKAGNYYLREGEVPLCNSGDNSTLDKAAHFLDEPKNQNLKFTIEGMLNTDSNYEYKPKSYADIVGGDKEEKKTQKKLKNE